MKPEAQRIAIAKACGWTLVGINTTAPVPVFSSSQLTGRTPEGYVQLVPNYLIDLNTMHEVEETLTHEQYIQFHKELGWIVAKDEVYNGPSYFIVHATAARRAEAFLKTLNLWNDE